MKLPAVCGTVIVLTIALSGTAAAQQKSEKLAQSAAEAWLALVDAGNYSQSWQGAA